MGQSLICSYLIEDQFVVAGGGIGLHAEADARQFSDHQFAGGVDDAAGAEVTANGLQIFLRQGDVDVAAVRPGGTVETDDLVTALQFVNVDTAGVPDPSLEDAAHTGENDSPADVLLSADRADGFQQVLSPL